MFKNLVWILFLFIIGVSSSATATQRPILNSTLAGGTYPWDTARGDMNNNYDDLYIHWTLITVTSPVDLDTMDALIDANVIQISELVTLSGVPAHSTDLGTFPGGTTIPDNSDNKEALAALEVAVEAAGPGVDENYVTDAELVTLGNQSGTNSGDATIGTANGLSFVGQVLSLAAATNGNPGAMTAAFVLNIESLITLSGVLADATDFGTFTGVTIPDGSTNKAALQALETAVEAGGASTWGAITGTLANQTDLQSALDAKADLNGTQAIVTTDSVTASEVIVPFVDNAAGVIWTSPNTNYVPVAGTYGIVPEADGLKQIVNGVKSAIGGGGAAITEVATEPAAVDMTPSTLYVNQDNGGLSYLLADSSFVNRYAATSSTALHNIFLTVAETDGSTVDINGTSYSNGGPYTISALTGSIPMDISYVTADQTVWTGADSGGVTGTTPNFFIDMTSADKTLIATISSISTFTDITYWNSWENTFTATPYLLGSGDYSSGDSDVSLLSAATVISTSPMSVGTQYLSIPTTGDSGEVTLSANDIFNVNDSRIGFWYRQDGALDDNQYIVDAEYDSQNFMALHLTSGGELHATVRIATTYEITVDTIGLTITPATEYYIEMIFDQAGNGFTLKVNGVNTSIASLPYSSTASPYISLWWGDHRGLGTGLSETNNAVSNDVDRDLYLLRNLTSSPR